MDIWKIEMTQGGQTDGEGGRIVQKICHVVQMLEKGSCLLAGWKGWTLVLGAGGRREGDVRQRLFPLMQRLC